MDKSKQEKCFTCEKDGIVQCDGCIHRFCLIHLNEHRQQLDKLFEQINDEQKTLFNKITNPYLLSESISLKKTNLLNEINQWERKTLNIVKRTANFARQQIGELLIPNNKITEDDLDNISEELEQRKKSGNYCEQDIERLSKKLKQIQTNLNINPPKIRIKIKLIDWSKIFSFLTETSKCDSFHEEQKFFHGGTLLTLDHQIQLNKFYNNPNQKWQLIYKATQDGFTSEDFHRCCDRKGPTLTLIQSTDKYLFGGYTTISWNKKIKGWTNDKTAFIFTLTNPYNIIPTKYIINNNGKGAIFSGGNGPVFGSIDIHINSNSNENKKNYIMFPQTYNDTTGKGHLTFTGTENFSTLEIEIYQLFISQE